MKDTNCHYVERISNMLRSFCRFLASVGLLLPLVGCHSTPFGALGGCDDSSTSFEMTLPAVERRALEADLDKLPEPPPPDDSGEAPKQQYRQLTAREAQCAAAKASSTANMLDQERASLQERADRKFCKHSESLTQLQQTILLHTALEARNQAAGTALEAYYRLVEAEARWELLQLILKQLDDALAKLKDLQNQGLKVQVDYDEMVRQRREFQAQIVHLQRGIQDLNSELRRLFALESCQESWLFWPAADLSRPVAALALEEALHDGLENRPQLLLLRELDGCLDRQSLPAVRLLLRSFNALLAMDQAPAGLKGMVAKLCASSEDAELDKTQRQLQQLLTEREQQVAHEIEQAVRAYQAQTELVRLARERLIIRKEKLVDLEAKDARGVTGFMETTIAKLDWLQARSDLLKEVIAQYVAGAKVRQARGLLVRECGFDGTSCCDSDTPPAPLGAPAPADEQPEQLPAPKAAAELLPMPRPADAEAPPRLRQVPTSLRPMPQAPTEDLPLPQGAELLPMPQSPAELLPMPRPASADPTEPPPPEPLAPTSSGARHKRAVPPLEPIHFEPDLKEPPRRARPRGY